MLRQKQFSFFFSDIIYLAIKGFRTISIRNAFESFFSFFQKKFCHLLQDILWGETQRFTSNFCWISRKALVMNTKFLSYMYILLTTYYVVSTNFKKLVLVVKLLYQKIWSNYIFFKLSDFLRFKPRTKYVCM